MEDLSVTRVENGHVVVTGADGREYRVAIDEVTLSRLRRASETPPTHAVSPRDIQAHLRAGLSRDEVAGVTGLSPDEIERFEGPVLAELEYIVTSALALPAPDAAQDGGTITVGARVQHQIERSGGTAPTWKSWRDPEGRWVVKCVYTVGNRSVEARWAFDAKHHALTPLDDEAASLLSLEVYSSGVIPRLRAVTPARETATTIEVVPELPAQELTTEAVAPDELDAEESELADGAATPTADLLAALRKRRSESADAPAWLAEAAAEGAQSPSITDELIELTESTTPKSGRTGSSKRNRATMPTWDEIVFGTKVEDDLI